MDSCISVEQCDTLFEIYTADSEIEMTFVYFIYLFNVHLYREKNVA